MNSHKTTAEIFADEGRIVFTCQICGYCRQISPEGTKLLVDGDDNTYHYGSTPGFELGSIEVDGDAKRTTVGLH